MGTQIVGHTCEFGVDMYTYFNHLINDIVIEKEIEDLDKVITLEEVANLIFNSCEYTAYFDGEEFEPEFMGNDCRCYDFEIDTDSIDGGDTYSVCVTDIDIRTLNNTECVSIRLRAELAS